MCWSRLLLVSPHGGPNSIEAVRIAQGRLVKRSATRAPLHGSCAIWVSVPAPKWLLTQWLHQQPWLARQPRAVLAQHQRFAHGQYGRFWMAPPEASG